MEQRYDYMLYWNKIGIKMYKKTNFTILSYIGTSCIYKDHRFYMRVERVYVVLELVLSDWGWKKNAMMEWELLVAIQEDERDEQGEQDEQHII